MRGPKRISECLGLIKEIWEKDPDLRFNQLIYNLQGGYSHENEGVGKVEEVIEKGFSKIGFDLFNLEDEQFIQYLRDMIANAE